MLCTKSSSTRTNSGVVVRVFVLISSLAMMNHVRIVRAASCFVNRHSSRSRHPLINAAAAAAASSSRHGQSAFFSSGYGIQRIDRTWLASGSLGNMVSSAATEEQEKQNASSFIENNNDHPYSSFPLSMADIKGVIFDMDGTLTKPCIDFPDMRRRIYQVASDDLSKSVNEGCVLEIPTRLSPKGQALCEEIFLDIEAKAICDMEFMDGLAELLKFLDTHHVPRAVLTRNVERSVNAMHEKLAERYDIQDPFHPAVARDTASPDPNTFIRAKPEPDGILYICQKWQCDPCQVIMVGDSDKDDIVAAYRAGCGASVLLMDSQKVHDNNSGNDDDSDVHERQPTIKLDSLTHLHDLLVHQTKQHNKKEQ